MEKKEEAEERLAEEAANRYDPAKFILVPDNFKPSLYKSIDLFDAVVKADQKPWGLFVSDVVFVGQSGRDIWFKTEDDAISQSMKIDSRSGLQEGQRVRVYYSFWRVTAIERL
jgi:hypothetical protein